MLSLALRMLRFRKGTFAATFLALAAGVAVLTVCASLVVSGLFYRGSPQRYAGAAAIVAHRELTVVETEMFGEVETMTVPIPEGGVVPDDLITAITRIPGVARAVEDRTVPLPGGPAEGHGYASTALTPYRMVGGSEPVADGQIAVDASLGLQPGAELPLRVAGVTSDFTVTGVVDGPVPAIFFADAQAAKWSPVGAVGVLTEPGADETAVVAAVRSAADRAGVRTYAGAEKGLAAEPAAAAGRDLAVQAGGSFGGYAAMIIAFVVASTVGLGVRHRRRDLALLRAIAATPGQVRRLVLGETALLTLLAAAAGLPAGLAASGWVRSELVDRGFVPESFTLTGTALAAPAVVLGVAVVALPAAWIAAVRTTRIRPAEALGEAAVETRLGGRGRLISGIVVLGAGAALVGVTGTTTGDSAMGAAVGMLSTFVLAVALLAPWINKGAAVALTPLLRTVWGSGGYLAGANLRANARGMVAVLTALVLSVGFGGSVWFLQDNLARQTVVQSRDGILASQAVTAPGGLPSTAAADLREQPGVAAAVGVRRTSVIVGMRIGAQAVVAQSVTVVGLDQIMDLGVRDGDPADLDGSTVAVSRSVADQNGWTVGSAASFWLGDGTPVTRRVVAVYDRGWGFGDVTLSATPGQAVDRVLVAGGPVTYPGATVTGTDTLSGQLAQDLRISAWLNKTLIAVLVGYAVLAAANTLVMAALARGRELSLLRLTGVTRGQVRRMVVAEQAGLLGVAVGIGATITAVTLSSVVHAVAGQRIPYVPALGWVTIVAGTTALALLATVLPVGRLLRIRPVEGIGLRE